MSFWDLIRMSSSNLFKRKLRTILTILGVVIGTASIVVMISLGLALNQMVLSEIENNGSLTKVTVSTMGGGGMMFSGGGMVTYSEEDDDEGGEEQRLSDETIEELRGLEHVKAITPVLDQQVIALQGKYMGEFSLTAVNREYLESLNLEFTEGELPPVGAELQVMYGSQIGSWFYNPKDDMGVMWDENGQPIINVDMNKPFYYIFDSSAYWDSLYGSYDEDGMESKTVKSPKKYIINAAGQLAGAEYSARAHEVYCDIDVLLPMLRREFKNKPIPGQPTTRSGKAYKDVYYQEIYINVDKMDNVTKVQEELKLMGYQTYSDTEYIESQQKQFATIQLVLGCIGAVSLLVAAIGIANTMMMSIYERTKEIGVIKVLGCSLSNIRTLFLMEAAFIGFIGGVAGLALSYGISWLLNRFGATFMGDMMYMSTEGATASYIPLWLSGTALVFAMLIGMIAGFFPALRAMKLSPLAAIRSE